MTLTAENMFSSLRDDVSLAIFGVIFIKKWLINLKNDYMIIEVETKMGKGGYTFA